MFERQQFGANSHKVIFFIGGYKTKIGMYKPLYWIMRMLGYRVYAYVLDSQTVVSSNIKAYVGQVQAVQQDIEKTLTELPSSIKAYTMGNSLGSESALYAFKHTPQLRAASLITVRGSIAEFIWKSRAGRSFKPPYEKNGYDFTQISQELSPIEPLKDLELIGDRPVQVWYSTADTTIPADNTQQLVDALKNVSVKTDAFIGNKLDHGGITMKGCAMFWHWHRLFRQS